MYDRVKNIISNFVRKSQFDKIDIFLTYIDINIKNEGALSFYFETLYNETPINYNEVS